MKIMKRLFYIASMMLATILVGCSASGDNIDTTPEGLFKSIFVRANDNIYYGVVENSTKRIYFEGLEYGGEVTNVSYKLEDGATISPDPTTYIGDWPAQSEVTVISGDQSDVYTIYLPDYIAKDRVTEDEVDRPILFFDDFDGDELDLSSWKIATIGLSTWNRYMSESPDQTYVEDGNLVVRAEIVNGEYKTGGVQSNGLKAFNQARFEFCAKVSKVVTGGFIAIWLMPEPDKVVYEGGNPYSGEIDIMEHILRESYVYQTIHSGYTINDAISGKPDSYVHPAVDVTDYNVYRVDKTKDALVFYINDVETLYYRNLYLSNESEVMQWPFDTEFYMIINYALGGEGLWAGEVDDDDLPGEMLIDWVKVTSLED